MLAIALARNPSECAATTGNHVRRMWQLEHFKQLDCLTSRLLVAELDVVDDVQVVKVKHALHDGLE